MLRSVIFSAALLAVATVSASAQEHEGLWTGTGEGDLTVDLKHIEQDAYAITIDTVVPIENDIPGCGGGIEGEVLLDTDGGNFFVENEGYVGTEPESAYNMRYCEISLQLDEDGMLIIEEKSGCMYYHGAACGFTGTLQHDAAGI